MKKEIQGILTSLFLCVFSVSQAFDSDCTPNIAPGVIFLVNKVTEWADLISSYQFGYRVEASDLEGVLRYPPSALLPLEIVGLNFLEENEVILRQRGFKFVFPPKKAVEILDNRFLFDQYMRDYNFGAYIPALRGETEYPFILKKKFSYFGQHVHLINNEDDIPHGIDLSEYQRQEVIYGRLEYTSHMALKDGEIFYERGMSKEFHDEAYVFGKDLVLQIIES